MHSLQERDKNHVVSHQNDIHYRPGSRQTKKRIMDSQHLVEMEGSNKLHQGQLHQRKTVPASHMITIKTHDTKLTKELNLNYSDKSSYDEAPQVTTPDVGILSQGGGDDEDTAVNRNLRLRSAPQPPQSCLQEIIPILRRKRKTFKKPWCEEGFSYWTIQDDASFFFGGYCECETECPKETTTHCCAQGCLQCKDESNKAKYTNCGQFTAANFTKK